MSFRRTDPMAILRDYVKERQRRGSVPSLAGKLDEPHGTDRSHAEDRWVDLCGLVAGVSSLSLDVIELFVLGSKGTRLQVKPLDPSWNTKPPEWQPPDPEWEPVANPLTRKDVAGMLGLTTDRVKALQAEAVDIVISNQIRRGR